MSACAVAIAVVALCLVGSVVVVIRDARRTGGFLLTGQGWKNRWPLYALSLAAVVAVILAASDGC